MRRPSCSSMDLARVRSSARRRGLGGLASAQRAMPGSSATQLGAIALDIGEDDDPPLILPPRLARRRDSELAGNSGWFSSPIAVVQFLLFGWVISLTSGLTFSRRRCI